MIPPLLLRVRIHNQRHRFGLWVPLFLIVPLLGLFMLLVALLLLPFILVTTIVLWRRGWGRWLLIAGSISVRSCPRFFALLCSLRGLRIEVKNASDRVYISFR